MTLPIKRLNFSLPDKQLESYQNELAVLTKEVKKLATNAGTKNEKFKQAYSLIYSTIENEKKMAIALNTPIKVRALAVALLSGINSKIELTEDEFKKIDELRPNPSSLLIQNMYQYYLIMYDKLIEPVTTAKWISTALEKKGKLGNYKKNILRHNGPKWLANQCINKQQDFSNVLTQLNLENYASGRFLTVAKSIYFVEQLKNIPVNEPHQLLIELQNEEIFNSRYDEDYLLGHKVLDILITRAPSTEIDDSWLNLIMAIAGDPRIPTTHPKYQKWWSAIDNSLNSKVRGWLSRLDLRLFLEALENYSHQSKNEELKRMFASRKKFLEGLLKNKLVTNTRLYLSRGAVMYIRQNYKKEHLPNFSFVTDGNRSIIHVELGTAHMIEGSHSCYLWIYPKLDPSALVFDYNQENVSYSSLTKELSRKMHLKGCPPKANITHSPINFSWQKNAIECLKGMKINISPKDVLSRQDYLSYRRTYGVS